MEEFKRVLQEYYEQGYRYLTLELTKGAAEDVVMSLFESKPTLFPEGYYDTINDKKTEITWDGELILCKMNLNVTDQPYQIEKILNSKLYKIPVQWMVMDKIEVFADSVGSAVDYALSHLCDLPLGDDPVYINESYEIEMARVYSRDELVKYVKNYYNQED